MLLAEENINIAYIIDTLNIGGTEKQLIKQIELLESKGYRQTVICLRPSAFLNKLSLPCDIHIQNVSSLLSYHGLRQLFDLVRMLRKLKIDIVQTYFIDSNIFGVLAAKIAGVDNIISCRRDMGFWYSPKILKVLNIINFFVDRILVNSEAIKKNVCEFEKVSCKKVDVLYNGISLEPFKEKQDTSKLRNELNIPDSDTVVGIVANLNRPVKRVDLFVETAALVLKKMQDTSFVVVGGGHLMPELEKKSIDLGIQEKIKFVGLKDDVLPYLALFDIGVLTSESEGFSNSILEYMAAGLAVVCIDSGGNAELIENGKNGYCVDSMDVLELQKSICSIISDRQLMKKISRNNIAEIKRFAWENICLETCKYYMNLMKTRK